MEQLKTLGKLAKGVLSNARRAGVSLKSFGASSVSVERVIKTALANGRLKEALTAIGDYQRVIASAIDMVWRKVAA